MFIFIIANISQMFSSVYSNVTKTITMTVGKKVTISPFSDSKVLERDCTSCSSILTIDDPSAFSVSSSTGSITFSNATKYSFTLEALRTGFYTAKSAIGYRTSTSATTYESGTIWVNYNIIVVDVTSISLPSFISVPIGDSYTFSPIITDSRATTTISWQSSQPEVATISSNGILTALTIGTTIVSCTASNGVQASCEVTVTPVLSTSVSINPTESELTVGDKLQLEATVAPDNATNKSVTWSSTNEAVAVVDESGKVYAVGPGFSQIKAKANDGSNKTASCMVTVKDKTVLKGDVNGDGEVTVADAEEVIEIILNKN